ncbi:uncharacterized protein LODBEIA_P54670 [Lodderomyces beijingensis]|uniref:SUI1 domain-containing protein n=1 Tax=Lodderomyces beijingensis TaxID=1775926 RepID=A0ABP0ZSY4_9ASCO
MFRKSPQAKAAANIKSSDRRKLLSTICRTYNLPIDEISKEGLEKLLPAISKKASYISTSTGDPHSGTIYFDAQEVPTWFQTRDSQLYPSVLTCWKCPYLVPRVQTHPHVIEVLARGANLMLPGSIPPFDARCTKHAVVGVVSSQDPTRIMAVGLCGLDLTQFDSVLGRSGTAVQVLHHYDDELMKLNKEVDVVVPDVIDAEMPRIETVPDAETTEEVKEEEEQQQEQEDGGDAGGDSVDVDALEEDMARLTVEEIDNFFIRSLLQTIKLETFELPISASTFMSSYIYKNLPSMDASYTNIKKTSWKKTAKFLKAMTKLNYLDTKGKDEDLSVTKLMSKQDPKIENFVPHKINKPKNNQTGSKSSSSSSSSSQHAAMNITTLYKPTSKSRMFFNKLDQIFDQLYTQVELRSMYETYVKKFQLVNPQNPKTIILDEILSKPINKDQGFVIARDQFLKEFMTNFTPFYEVQNEGQRELGRGMPPKIHIVTELKIGRKVVTRVSNYDKFFIKQGAFAEELRNKCSGSSTIIDDQVQVQGPHGALIVEMLKSKGVPISCIDFEDKVKKKKRK